MPSGDGGATNEGDRRRSRARSVGEGPGVSYRRGGDSDKRTPELGQHQWMQSINLNQIGTEYSVSLASVQGV